MSPFTLGNWVVGILEYPEEAKKLIEMHRRVPHQALVDNLPGILEILNEMPRGRAEWQKALCLLAFPLMSK
jgi:acyl carrier protein phosphodiesterase